MNTNQAQQIVDEIFALYTEYGEADYIGEPVSQLEHMCQAAQLAEAAGADPELILAAFFHDIGHLCQPHEEADQMDGYGIAHHEDLGGDYLLEKGFSERLAKLVASHVAAKRYLTAVDDAYYEKLSEASKHTLDMQGGRMNAGELQQFESDPLHKDYLRLRRWDDQAKATDIPLPDLSTYKEIAYQCLLQNNPE